MSVKASGGIAFSKVPSVESETRYFLLTESSSVVPSKPTTVPPTGGWTQTEPTYDGTSTTGVLYTCVLTKFTNDTFSYSEVSVSSSYEVSKVAYGQAHEANQKLASWCSKTDTTLFDGAKIATGSVTTEALDAKCVTADKIDTADLFSQNITASGKIKSSNYNGTDSAPLGNTVGSILKMDNGTFNFGGGKLTYDGNDLVVKGKIAGESIDISGTYEGYNGTKNISIKTQKGTDITEPVLVMSDGASEIVIQDMNDGANPDVMINGSVIHIGKLGETSETYVCNLNIDGDVYAPCSSRSYSSFSGSVTSAGTITVTKTLGICFINGSVTLSAAVSNWTTILDNGKVPLPKNGEAIYATLPSWKAPTSNPARLRIPVDGSLQITRGSANAFWINLAYPYEEA